MAFSDSRVKAPLITLMFHRIHDDAQRFSYQQFSRYLKYLFDTYPIVVPGDPLHANQINLCLTFDDAYYDFYFYVYPLLKQYQIKALLAVPVKYIVEKTTLPQAQRLQIPYPQGMNGLLYQEQVPFCTWEELKEMTDSGWVKIGSHSYSHPNLTDPDCDLMQEISFSKEILEDKLKSPIDSFVYPYGRYNPTIHQKVKELYRWDFRIGSALNYQWERTGPLYRIDAEKLWPFGHPLSSSLLLKLKTKYWVNKIRGK